MSTITIISHPPKPRGITATTEDRQEFSSVSEAIAYLQSLPTDELPAGDGSSES